MTRATFPCACRAVWAPGLQVWRESTPESQISERRSCASAGEVDHHVAVAEPDQEVGEDLPGVVLGIGEQSVVEGALDQDLIGDLAGLGLQLGSPLVKSPVSRSRICVASLSTATYWIFAAGRLISTTPSLSRDTLRTVT